MSNRTEPAAPAAVRSDFADRSYVDWPAILAGTVVAAAIGFVFSTFGAALGLSLISPYSGEGSALAAVIAVGLWMLWTTISSFMAGGYIAGRMRHRAGLAQPDEVSVRDGIHGLAVWGIAVLLGAYVLGAGVSGAVRTGAEAAGAVAEAVDQAVDTGASEAPPAEAPDAAVSPDEAEQVRIYGVVSAFTVSAALFIAAASSYWAAGLGGRHRDESRTFPRFGHWS